jgi:hypothetical protein
MIRLKVANMALQGLCCVFERAVTPDDLFSVSEVAIEDC